MEKLLLEACLEAMRTGAIVGIQDMGAAGLTCSTCEMGSRAGTGVEIDLKYVPQRETGMTPYEIMLSESQERMLIVAEAGREDEVFAVFHKWGLDAVTIGTVTNDGILRVKDHGEIVAEIPNRALADEAPLYDRPHTKPDRPAPLEAPEFRIVPRPLPFSARSDRAAGSARYLLQALDLGAVRLSGPQQHPCWARRRRRHRAHQGDRHIDRDFSRRQRPLLRARSSRRRAS